MKSGRRGAGGGRGEKIGKKEGWKNRKILRARSARRFLKGGPRHGIGGGGVTGREGERPTLGILQSIVNIPASLYFKQN